MGVAQEICTLIRPLRLSEHVTCPDGGVLPDKSCWTRPGIEEDDAQTIADNVMAEVKELGGDGGVILVTPEGHALFSFNTTGMYRGRATSDGLNEVAIFGGDVNAEASSTPDH